MDRTDALRQSIVMQPRSCSDVDHCRFPPASRCSDKPVQSFNGAGSWSRSQHADSTATIDTDGRLHMARNRHGQRDLGSAGHRPPWFRQCKKPDVPHGVACGNWRCCVRVHIRGWVCASQFRQGRYFSHLACADPRRQRRASRGKVFVGKNCKSAMSEPPVLRARRPISTLFCLRKHGLDRQRSLTECY